MRITREIALAAFMFAAPVAAQNWIQSPVNGHSYALTPSSMTWVEAEAYAVAHGAHLVTVRSAAENQWLASTFATGGVTDFWIGYNDAAVEGTYVWSSGESAQFANWAPGEPNNFENEDYVQERASGFWNDSQAQVVFYGVIESPVLVIPSAMFSFTPVPLTITGAGLDTVTTVLLEGAAVPIVSQSPTTLLVQPAPSEPGSKGVELVSASGTIVAGNVELWPSLAASTTGIGGTASVGVRNGTAGIAVIAYAAGLLPPPGISLPPTWSTLKLDITGPYVIVASYGLPTSGELDVVYPIPSDPSLAGSTAHIQAWCQQGFFGPGVTYSFTNAAAVTF